MLLSFWKKNKKNTSPHGRTTIFLEDLSPEPEKQGAPPSDMPEKQPLDTEPQKKLLSDINDNSEYLLLQNAEHNNAEPLDFSEEYINHGRPKKKQSQIQYEKFKNKKRRLEIIFALVLFLVVVLVTWGQLNFFGNDSWVFFVLVNINAILMLVVLFLVARNVIRLLLERRRKIFGAKLRTRLVLAFFSISFVPILIMFLSANKILTTSVNYWFTGQVENSMQAALEVGQSFYNAASERLQLNLSNFSKDLAKSPQSTWKSTLSTHKSEYILSMIAIMQRQEGENMGKQNFSETVWVADADFTTAWSTIRHSINFQNISKNNFESLLWADPKGDYVIIVMPLANQPDTYILGAQSIGKGLITQLDKISAGFQQYTELKNLKQPLKLSFSLILGLLSLIVLFAAVWLAFRISGELTEPILALAKGTKRVAQGNWNVSIDDKGQDELGQLAHSFNRMTATLRDSQNRLQKMNWLIEEKNEMLTERNQYIEAILENITTGIVTLDDKGILVTINKATCDIFRIRSEEYEGLPIYNFLSAKNKDLIDEMFAYIRKNPDRIWTKEIEFLRQDLYSKIHIQALTLPTYYKEEPPSWETNSYLMGSIILVIEDITELSQEQRLVAWKEVAKRIAHEIKNPLTPIKLSAERLQRKFAKQVQDEVFSQCTDLIIKEVNRMQSMVADFSSLAALPDIKTEKQSLIPILQELVSLFKTSHSSITWIISEKSPVPELPLDKKALHRALFNILSNAADAIASTTAYNAIKESSAQKIGISNVLSNSQNSIFGRVEIVYFDSESDYAINKAEELPLSNLIIEIIDNGQGIESEEAVRLFEPYFSKKATGTGLGLTIVRSVINDHGGNISAHKKDNGTCIRIALPY